MITFFIKENLVYRTQTKGSMTHTINIGNIDRINLQDKTTQLNTLTQIPIMFQIFDLDQQQYITDESINKTVDVYVNGELATTEDIVNGEGVIQFESAEAGTFKIRVENAECEVVVNG